MFKVLLIGMVVLVVIVYILLSSINSDSSKQKQKEKKIKLEQEKEKRREAALDEKIEKNRNHLKDVAKIVVGNKEKLLTDYFSKSDFKKLSYDYYTKDLTIEEQKAFYEDKIQKLKILHKETSQYTSFLPFMIQRIYNWYRFTYHYSEHLFDSIKEMGFDTLINIKSLFNEAVKFDNEVKKTISAAEKAYSSICATVDSRKKIVKELKRLNKEVVILNNVEIEIEGSAKVFDHIVSTESGVFCIHTKYLPDDSNENLYISEDNQWTGETFAGQRYHVDSVEGEVYKNIQSFQKWLNTLLKENMDESVPYFMTYPIVVVANDLLQRIDNESDYTVLRIEDVFNHIKLFKGQKIEPIYLSEIKNILEANCKEHTTDTIDDNIEQLQKNAEIIQNVFKTIDVVNECCVDYCKTIESVGIIRAYRQYLAIEHFMKYQTSVKDARKIRSNNQGNYVNYLQDPEKPLIDRLITPCITAPVKLLAHSLNLSISKTEDMIKTIYDFSDLKTVPAISYQYINQAMTELISMNVSKEVLETYMHVETLNNIKLHKFKYFEINPKANV